MPIIASLLPGGFKQRGDGSGDEADEKPGKLGGEVAEGVINHRREGDHADDAANTNGQEEAQVGEELFPDVRQPADEGFVNAKYHQEHSAGEPWGDGADTGENAFYKANDPGNRGTGAGLWDLRVFNNSHMQHLSRCNQLSILQQTARLCAVSPAARRHNSEN